MSPLFTGKCIHPQQAAQKFERPVFLHIRNLCCEKQGLLQNES